ncbi:MAG: PEP-CTERM sorting domain-containing protein [Pirellulaceae bacterium]
MVNFNGEWVIAGVLSGGTTATSVYGDISWWTGVAPYRADIEAAGGVFFTAVPEPGTAMVLIVAFGLIGHRRRNRIA